MLLRRNIYASPVVAEPRLAFCGNNDRIDRMKMGSADYVELLIVNELFLEFKVTVNCEVGAHCP